GDAFLLPECGYAREVEFRLRQARLCLNQLRLGGAHTSVAFFLRATRLVNNSLIVARTDTREYGPTDDGRAWLQRAQTSVGSSRLMKLDDVTGHTERQIHLGVRSQDRRVFRGLAFARQGHHTHADRLDRRG